MAVPRFATGERVRLNAGAVMPARQAEFLARNGHAVPDYSGTLGTVRRHTRLWSWGEGNGPPTMTFEKIAVDLDGGATVSCEPGWLDRMVTA